MDTLDQKFSLYKIDETPSKLILNNKENILLSLYENSFIRVYNMSNLKSLGLIQIPNEDISQFDLCLNNNGIILTTNHDKIYLIQIQNWQPLSLLYTDITNNLINYLPKNQNCKSIKSKSISNEKSYVCSCYSDGNVLIFTIEKLNGKIEVNLIDKYNMIEIHMSKTEDNNIKEMYANLSKFKSDYKCSCLFSPTFNGICLSFHECLQFLYIRNFEKNENIKIVPLNYFPYSLDVSDNEKHICVGTKDGLLLYITKNEVSYKGGFNLDIFEGHYDNVDTVKFSHDSLKLFTTSFNEILVWNVKESGNN
jgi:WD40 repeat protein